jgi:glycerol kinase
MPYVFGRVVPGVVDRRRNHRRIAMHAVPLASRYPHPGWVEQRAMKIWQAQLSTVKAVLRLASRSLPREV